MDDFLIQIKLRQYENVKKYQPYGFHEDVPKEKTIMDYVKTQALGFAGTATTKILMEKGWSIISI